MNTPISPNNDDKSVGSYSLPHLRHHPEPLDLNARNIAALLQECQWGWRTLFRAFVNTLQGDQNEAQADKNLTELFHMGLKAIVAARIQLDSINEKLVEF